MKYKNPKNNFEEEMNRIYKQVQDLNNNGKMAYVPNEISCLNNIYELLTDEQQRTSHFYFMTIYNKI